MNQSRSKVYSTVLLLVRLFLKVATRMSVSGVENVPSTGSAIIAGNHISLADPMVLVSAVARVRQPRMMAAAGLFKTPVLGRLLRHARFIPVYRWGGNPAAALAPALETLEAGEMLGLYPEGEISRDPGLWPVRARTGIVRLALDSGAPVVPVAQWGTASLLPAKKRRLFLNILRRPRIQVLVGAPLDLRLLLGVTSAAEASPEKLREGAQIVMDTLTTMLASLRPEPCPPRAGREKNPPRLPSQRSSEDTLVA